MRRRIAAGNWKMHGTSADLPAIDAIARAAAQARRAEVLLCLPATLLHPARGRGVALGGQDCHAGAAGAFTGDLSATMLADAGAGAVILGHSERRQGHHEADADIAAKILTARMAGLTTILCIGETAAQQQTDQTLEVLAAQIAGSLPEGATPANTVIAYEPVWAIGTGRTPTPEQIAATHTFIRSRLPDPGIAVLYGGSVSPANAASIFALPDVDGGLVGGASLKPETFIPIIDALEAA